jgi:hypothetical protein
LTNPEDLARRIEASFFATEEEMAEAKRLASRIPDPEAHRDLLSLVRAVADRERGVMPLSREERQALNESLQDLETRLIEEIKERKTTQRRDTLTLFIALLCALTATGAASFIIVLNESRSVRDALARLTCLAFLLSASILTARLFQNSREALERLDEKVVAVRFLRMALHPSWTNSTSSELLNSAVSMFMRHFAPQSATLGVEDTLKLMPKLPSFSKEEQGNK